MGLIWSWTYERSRLTSEVVLTMGMDDTTQVTVEIELEWVGVSWELLPAIVEDAGESNKTVHRDDDEGVHWVFYQ